MEKSLYHAPIIEVAELSLESNFAASAELVNLESEIATSKLFDEDKW